VRDLILAIAAFVFGCVVGSFLNACIYRMPRGIGLDNPRRSFCPHCKTTIPWHQNLPALSWLFLRGKCASCGAPIAFRYWFVEVLTGAVFLFLWWKFRLPLAPVYCVFAALLVAATFIDFDFFIIPDEITIGGTVAGIVLSALVPAMMGVSQWWMALALSIASAALGFGLLWAVVELGKLAFGKKRHALAEAEPLAFRPDAGDPAILIGGEAWQWSEIFSRESDVLVIECDSVRVNGVAAKDPALKIYYNRFVMDGREIPIEEVRELAGSVRAVVVPREAMGFGDVKFIACIGAFLGWEAVLFTLFASSISGALIGGGMLLVTGGKSGGKIPYGPYLALGALLWLAVGREAVAWYFGLFRSGLAP